LGDMADYQGELAEMKVALELDPVSDYPHKSLATFFLQTGRYDEAIREAKMALELNPVGDPARGVLARAYEEQRKYPEASAEFKKIGSSLGVAHVYAVSGDEAKARLFLRKLRQKASTTYVPHRAFALVLVGLRENDAAIAELEKADMEGEPLDYINQDSRSKPLHSDPRFQALLRRHHIPI